MVDTPSPERPSEMRRAVRTWLTQLDVELAHRVQQAAAAKGAVEKRRSTEEISPPMVTSAPWRSSPPMRR